MSIGILEAVRDELIACEAVGSGRVFCESWLAKDASYIRELCPKVGDGMIRRRFEVA